MGLEKAYIRFRDSLPESPSTFSAAEGFILQGVPIEQFHGFGDLDELYQAGKLNKKTIVCGYVGDVDKAFELLGVVRKIPPDYPDHLRYLLRRKVWETTLGEVKASVVPVFVKPVKQKLFTGRVWDPADQTSRLILAVYPDDTAVIASEIIDFVSEWRAYVRNHELVGIKHYKGDYTFAPNRSFIRRAIAESKEAGMPEGYSIDLGVTDEVHTWGPGDISFDHRTALIEVNDGCSLGNYGISSFAYARLLEERWNEVVSGQI